MREIRTSGSVGAAGGNSRGDPTANYRKSVTTTLNFGKTRNVAGRYAPSAQV